MPVTFPHPEVRTGPYFVAAKVLAGANPRGFCRSSCWRRWRGGSTGGGPVRVRPRGDGLLLGLAVTVGIPAIVIAMAFLLSANDEPPATVVCRGPLAVGVVRLCPVPRLGA